MRRRFPRHIAGRILEWIYRFSLREGFSGDVEEEYAFLRGTQGRLRAERWIWGQTLRGLPSLARLSIIWSLVMLRNYSKIALRNLVKNRVYAVINLIGLTLGIASCTLIFLYVRHETTFDAFHDRADRIYRAHITEDPADRDAFSYVHAPYHLAEALRSSFPEVESTVRLETGRDILRVGDRSFTQRFHLADEPFFQVFNFPLIRGTADGALKALDSVVLTETTAEKLFGDTDPMGSRLTLKLGGDFYDFTVTGIAQDPPTRSSIRFELLIPFENVTKYRARRQLDHWLNIANETYALLSRPLSGEAIDQRLAGVVRNHYPERFADIITLHLQPIRDIHLNPDVPPGFEPVSSPLYSRILAGIGFLILIIACVNFMSLSLGGSATRAREVGVRKVLGAARSQLVLQFLGETVLLSLAAMGSGLLAARFLLPRFNGMTLRQLTLSLDPPALAFLAALTIGTGLLAGAYPALFLSRFQPARAVHQGQRTSGPNRLIRTLVIIQFALSIGFIICTFAMRDQFHFLIEKELGFDRDQVVVVENHAPRADSARIVERLRTDLASNPEVISVSGASSTFARDWTQMGFRDEDGNFRQFFQLTVDHDYLDTLGISLRAGRFFAREFGSDSSESVVVNRAFLRAFQWDSGIGRRIPGPDFPPHSIIGVVEDFHFQNLRNRVEPLAMVLDPALLMEGISDIGTSHPPHNLGFIHVRMNLEAIGGTIERLEAAWKRVAPLQPFRFSFLDEDVQRQYGEIKHWGSIIGSSSVFIVLIACLGLFGLAAMTAVRRTREIGVRKVLGASTEGIVWLLAREFGKPVLAANLLAWPVAFFAMRRWLEDFPYRTGPGAERFLLAALLALAVAMATVAWQSFRAARADPVRTIRHE